MWIAMEQFLVKQAPDIQFLNVFLKIFKSIDCCEKIPQISSN